MKDAKGRIISGIIFLAISIAFYINGATKLKAAAFHYPRYIIIGVAVCSIILIFEGITKMSKAKAAGEAEAAAEEGKVVITRETVINLALVCAMTVAYIALLNILGYILTTILFIAGTLLVLRVKKIWLIVLVSVGVTMFLYFMFNNFLSVTLPIGEVFYNLLY